MRSFIQKHIPKILGKSLCIQRPNFNQLLKSSNGLNAAPIFMTKKSYFTFSSKAEDNESCVIKNGKFCQSINTFQPFKTNAAKKNKGKEEIKEKLSSITLESGKNIIVKKI
jgi:hypothetical protein